MGPKNVLNILAGAALLAGIGPAIADPYRPGEYFGLDLSTALLSPTPLGPRTQFAPVRVEANSGPPVAQAPAKPAAQIAVAKTGTAPMRSAISQPGKRGAVRTRLARRHRGNPLDAEAFDTRIQVWPCRSGGICNWQR